MASLLEEFASDGVGDEFGVGFAFSGFHHLAGEKVDEFFESHLFGKGGGVGFWFAPEGGEESFI